MRSRDWSLKQYSVSSNNEDYEEGQIGTSHCQIKDDSSENEEDEKDDNYAALVKDTLENCGGLFKDILNSHHGPKNYDTFAS
mmetsp:Transcript_38692/g.28570  ORF Transcript_38692/g.28570 Transcript_38692/m.28570 type:complete len:82 (+) Transcript_38692:1848-2093(+)